MAARRIVTAICLVGACAVGVARAGAQDLPPEEPATFRTFGSSVGYGGPGQVNLMCMLVNVGKTRMRVKRFMGFDESGASLPMVSSCGFLGQTYTFEPGEFCRVDFRVGNNHAAGCRGLVDRRANLRGRAFMFGSTNRTNMPIE